MAALSARRGICSGGAAAAPTRPLRVLCGRRAFPVLAAQRQRCMHAAAQLAPTWVPALLRRPAVRRGCVAVRAQHQAAAGGGAAGAVVDVEKAKVLLDREGWKVLDIRSVRDYEAARITKPARCSFNVPWEEGAGFLAKVAALFPSPAAAKIIVTSADGGAEADAALTALAAKGYTGAVKMEGGYEGWAQVWSPSGKRRPPPGRWVPTGKEALKSGLPCNAADAYDEGGNLAQARYFKGLAGAEGEKK